MMLPEGVTVHDLTPHADSRGVLIEVFRASWSLEIEPVQWNAVSSAADVLRGVHAHWRHEDYLTVVAGRATIGLHDLRRESKTAGLSATVELTEHEPRAIVLPIGVAHGFYFHEPSMHVYGVTHDWDTADELGCRWDDPGLGIDWPCSTPTVSERDRSLGTLAELAVAWRTARAAADRGQ